MGGWPLFVARGLITLPQLITFAQLMSFVAGPIQIISERYSATVAAAAVCKNVLSFLDAPTDETSQWGQQPLHEIESITLQDICCRKGEREVLRHIDITLRKGDRIALLGESGSGKSTLLNVLAAMCGAEGAYEINGRPVHDYAYADFRRQVTLLPQKSFVFSASIRDNISMFSCGAQEDEALRQTLADAGLASWYAARARPWMCGSGARSTRSPAARSGGLILRARFGERGVWSCWTSRRPDLTQGRAQRWKSRF